MKLCSKCKVEKPATTDYFCKYKRSKIGLRAECKECEKKYRQENKEKLSIAKREYQQRTREDRKKYLKKYYEENKEKYKIKAMEYRQSNKRRINDRLREKRRNNENFRLGNNLRKRIYNAIKNDSKFSTSNELLGCTMEEFKIYLESKFKPDMTWENYGLHGWHIDHIIPCASFDLTDAEQQKICFHYSNMQPLWAKDNLSKSDKVEETQLNLLI